jgi:hypothetical protein
LGRRGRAQQRHEKADRVRLLIERSLHQSVGNDTHDGSPRCRFTRVKNTDLMPDRALICPMLPRKARVHYRDRLFCVGIINREIAPF